MENKSIVERMAEAQNAKAEMRRAIAVLINTGEDATELCEEFKKIYGEPVITKDVFYLGEYQSEDPAEVEKKKSEQIDIAIDGVIRHLKEQRDAAHRIWEKAYHDGERFESSVYECREAHINTMLNGVSFLSWIIETLSIDDTREDIAQTIASRFKDLEPDMFMGK